VFKLPGVWGGKRRLELPPTAFSTSFSSNTLTNYVPGVSSTLYTGWAKKPDLLSVDNSAMVSVRKTCDKSKILECCKE